MQHRQRTPAIGGVTLVNVSALGGRRISPLNFHEFSINQLLQEQFRGQIAPNVTHVLMLWPNIETAYRETICWASNGGIRIFCEFSLSEDDPLSIHILRYQSDFEMQPVDISHRPLRVQIGQNCRCIPGMINAFIEQARNQPQRLGERLVGQQQLQINNTQSTHTASVHESVTNSLIRLAARYGDLDEQRCKVALQNFSRTLTQIAYPDVPTLHLEAAQRCIQRMMTLNGKENGSQFSFSKILSLIWAGLHDAQNIKAINQRDGSDLTQQKMLEKFIYHLYLAQRIYNLDDQDRDNNQTDCPSCFGGTINQIVSALNTVHEDVEVVLMTRAIATLRAQPLIEEKLIAYLCSLEQNGHQEALAVLREQLISTTQIPLNVWEIIKADVMEEFLDEFEELVIKEGKSTYEDIIHYSWEAVDIDPIFTARLDSALNNIKEVKENAESGEKEQSLLTSHHHSRGLKKQSAIFRHSCLIMLGDQGMDSVSNMSIRHSRNSILSHQVPSASSIRLQKKNSSLVSNDKGKPPTQKSMFAQLREEQQKLRDEKNRTKQVVNQKVQQATQPKPKPASITTTAAASGGLIDFNIFSDAKKEVKKSFKSIKGSVKEGTKSITNSAIDLVSGHNAPQPKPPVARKK